MFTRNKVRFLFELKVAFLKAAIFLTELNSITCRPFSGSFNELDVLFEKEVFNHITFQSSKVFLFKGLFLPDLSKSRDCKSVHGTMLSVYIVNYPRFLEVISARIY